GGERNRHTFDFPNHGIFRGISVSHTTTALHQVHQNFVPDSDHTVLADFARFELGCGSIRQDEQAFDNTSFVFGRGLDHEVNVVRGAEIACLNNSQPANDHVAGVQAIEVSAEVRQVL